MKKSEINKLLYVNLSHLLEHSLISLRESQAIESLASNAVIVHLRTPVGPISEPFIIVKDQSISPT
jgi:hypothetical protein